MLLSLVLVAAMPPGAETRLASEELAARTWVAGHANALPDRLDAVSSFNMFYRKAIYRALPLEKRKALWREQLEAFLAPAEQLSAPQRRMVQALRRPLTAWERATISSVLDSLDHAFDPALTSAQRSAFGKKICRITRGAFDRSSGAIVFATPGPIDATYVRLISAPVAYRASVVGGMHLSLRASLSKAHVLPAALAANPIPQNCYCAQGSWCQCGGGACLQSWPPCNAFEGSCGCLGLSTCDGTCH